MSGKAHDAARENLGLSEMDSLEGERRSGGESKAGWILSRPRSAKNGRLDGRGKKIKWN